MKILCPLLIFTTTLLIDSVKTRIVSTPKYIFNSNGLGAYSFEFETDDGTFRKEEGGSSPIDGSLVVRGQFGYIDSRGYLYTAENRTKIDRLSVPTRMLSAYLITCVVLQSLLGTSDGVIYTYEDVELRRIFPKEFPQDTIRRSGSVDPEHLGRYNELKRYFKFPKAQLNSHFEELECFQDGQKKLCRIDLDRYSPDEDAYYLSPLEENYVDRRRFVVLVFVAVACAAPQNPQDVQILRYDINNGGLDSYNFAWELSDGSKHEEQGQLKNQGTENEGIAVQGRYAWVGPDGVTYIVSYIADENGFQPTIEQGSGGAIPPAVVAQFLG
ncbi:unnamed protein product [Chilo suppressalis]|uniref:Uncharacterized protein n=1 Tax=Chilo suppressalis TaxID=168631 RepID=A0ABN8BDS2_CHISP|nr:unnamed protein product [Chilo suppressalis]